ncbi:hypothetical protein [Myceligenerans pegani]|uniref:Uncharacterized protein n=1 Tax=Myceligenerans pegani TaxID=2776917 RepID=A0ABR9MWY6_9MICO|nr:hypothetical protein [Myceligenerans sp. TRM 65318]MBE1875561.1 hypothetical protein [Myceligenerans sp. TRM 65318]MBE3017832.1 hypothetical protein [Myceligenerans sp. TRM 65318]
MPGSRTLRVETEEWRRLQRAARAGATDSVAGIFADHLDAPVRALLVTTAGERGVWSRLTMVGGQSVIVAQRIASVEGEIRAEPGAQITFTGPDELWRSLARTLPDKELLRAPASAAVEGDRPLALGVDDAQRLLGREECNLCVQVEAWCGGDVPVMVWGRLWSVVEDQLIDVRADGDELRLVERPAGSVAKELRWALTGAVDATTRQEAAG